MTRAEIERALVDYASACETMTLADEMNVSAATHRAAEKRLEDAFAVVERIAHTLLNERRAAIRNRVCDLAERGAYRTAAELADAMEAES